MPVIGRARILLVEDNPALRSGLARALREAWGDVYEAADGDRAIALLRDRDVEAYDVIVTDLRLPGADGVEVLRAARDRDARTCVLVLTAFGTVETAVTAMKLGAFDFLQKPVDLEQLDVRIARAVEHSRLLREVGALRAERAEKYARARIVGTSRGLRDAVELATRAAPTRATVLITGETGTGKELIAGLIHGLSARADAPFVTVNCAAIPETLLEAELFGHERGAFTGADRTRVGRFEQADGGTLFLDEIGDMSPPTQAKILRVLQNGEFHRLGSTRARRTDVRIVAATNRDLDAAIRAGSFREDLYFRLNVIGIHVPPLRERVEDIEPLARALLEKFARELGRPRSGFTAGALERIRAHAWPGNVRELGNAIERAVLMSDGMRITRADLALGPDDAAEAPAPPAVWRPQLPRGGLPLAEAERALVLEALSRSEFVQKDAAKLLRISRRKLNYMIAQMGITHPSWRRNRGDTPHAAAGPAGGHVEGETR
ncbi:MAG: sigma-54-dependent Fis family transcriptional regulator [Deltaproteobacteria bacterium]|nr:MAG: sigma-54-dependent Fis family transcriptional regulator [Deltaproteobacteria bacterium]